MSSAPSHAHPNQSIYRVADLSQTRATRFDLAPDSSALRQIAAELDLSALRKLRFTGEIRAEDKTDWRIEARLGATVVQPCVVTLDPVTTRIDQPITRLYVADYEEPDAAEVEMPEDDTVDPLPTQIDLTDVMIEALALHIPAYPRLPGTETAQAVFTEPGKAPMTDADMRPFAGLAALRDRLADKDDS